MEVTITRYLKRLDVAKSKKCNNSFAIVILAQRIGKKSEKDRGKISALRLVVQASGHQRHGLGDFQAVREAPTEEFGVS